jgi:hypothetical protein
MSGKQENRGWGDLIETCHIKTGYKKLTGGNENEIEIENGHAVFNWREFRCAIGLWW